MTEQLKANPLYVFATEVIHGAYKPEELKDAAMRAIRHHSAQPAQAVPDCGEAGHDEGCCGNRDCLPSARKKAPQQAEAVPPTHAAQDVLAERQRQISAEGWTPEHDDEHGRGALAAAAACYALDASAPYAENAYWREARRKGSLDFWPWDREWWKPSDQRRNLVKAGALILAEIERLDRAAAKKEAGHE